MHDIVFFMKDTCIAALEPSGTVFVLGAYFDALMVPTNAAH